MKFLLKVTALLISIGLITACADNNHIYAPSQSLTKENKGILVSKNNMTLYIFDRDVKDSGKSVCNDQCANNWPPYFIAPNNALIGNSSLVVRGDGKMQLAYKGMPLYYYSGDKKPDDRNGENMNSIWHTVKM